jgi:hypothetical protein
MIKRAAVREHLEVTEEFHGYEWGRAHFRYGESIVDLGWNKAPPIERIRGWGWQSGLYAHLKRLAEQAHAEGVELVLLTYPSGKNEYGTANAIIRETAQLTHTTLVDAAAIIQPLCPPAECPQLLFPDQHPTAEAHMRVADALVEKLERAN